ncbi:hypothetical protein [Vibrio amylolyticus]|nr:hypothetical protein [Vibrio amylolyticus]
MSRYTRAIEGLSALLLVSLAGKIALSRESQMSLEGAICFLSVL